MLDSEVLDEIIRIDPVLYESYQLYQNLLTAINLRTINYFGMLSIQLLTTFRII